jgi:preprotein translocase subunit SecF
MVKFIREYQQRILLISILCCFGSLGLVWHYGLNLGLEFTGGVEVELSTKEPASVEQMNTALNQTQGTITSFGSSTDFLIKFHKHEDLDETVVKEQFIQVLSEHGIQAEITRIDIVGSEFSEGMLDQAITALFVAFLSITCYIAIRFEIRLAISAILALLFDPIIILGAFAYFRWTFDAPTLAGLLAVIGYSINDTIVVFDRVRENFQRSENADSETLFFDSIEQTLGRTIITSMLTFMVVLALLIFGTEVLRGFSLALAIGIVVGTFSSIIVAGPIALRLGVKREHLFPPEEPEVISDNIDVEKHF